MWNSFSEDELLNILSRFWINSHHSNIIVPNGDDALALYLEGDNAFLLTVDTSLENVHFTQELLSFKEIGYRAVAGALSDIAAMGGYPLTILIDLEVPLPVSDKIEEIYSGIEELSRIFKFSIGGGNIVKGDRWRITTTVAGTVEKDYILTRTSFKPGEYLYLTGDVGRVYFFFDLLNEREKYPELFNLLRDKFARPIPRIEEISHLKKSYKINGAIDISDGLGIDLTRVAKSSNVKIVLNLEDLPVKDELKTLCSDKEEFYKKICSSGEEYEVCFSSKEEIEDPRVTKIGYVEKGNPEVIGIIGNKEITLTNLGYDHLKSLR
ncbi:MAG: thiamine-phosphate kinase [Candidatus Hydrothermia bacterium]